jgi:hypothetical protein
LTTVIGERFDDLQIQFQIKEQRKNLPPLDHK